MKRTDIKHTLAVAGKLFVICLVVAALVAAVFVITEGPIAAGELARKEQAIGRIFTELDRFEEYSISAQGVVAAYAVYGKNGDLLGYCVDYTGNSDYGGEVAMMIGVSAQGSLVGLQVISHAETFIDRYLDQNNLYTGADMPRGADLSAGATMSYNAIRDAIEAVLAIDFGGGV